MSDVDVSADVTCHASLRALLPEDETEHVSEQSQILAKLKV